MKAIDVLFNRIDELNSMIKVEKNTHEKYVLALEIKEIIKTIGILDQIQRQDYLETQDRHIGTIEYL